MEASDNNSVTVKSEEYDSFPTTTPCEIYIKEEYVDDRISLKGEITEQDPIFCKVDFKQEFDEENSQQDYTSIAVKEEIPLDIEETSEDKGVQKFENTPNTTDHNLSHDSQRNHKYSYCCYPHKKEKYFQCSQCDYKSIIAANLRKHVMARHTGEKPHQCPHCDYKVVAIGNLKRHIMARHTGEKPFQCPHCDYKVLTNGNLQNHIMARHTGERPHQCPQCNYKAVTAGLLKNHIMAHHAKVKPFHCSECGYKSVLGSKLKRHQKALHPEINPEECEYKLVEIKL